MEEHALNLVLETAPRKILILLDNLFFAAKINQAAARAGVRTTYAKTSIQALSLARSENPFLIIVDLDDAKCAPMEFLLQIKADSILQTIPTLGFASHVNTGIQQQAREAGCDRIMVRSVFDRNLATLFDQNS